MKPLHGHDPKIIAYALTHAFHAGATAADLTAEPGSDSLRDYYRGVAVSAKALVEMIGSGDWLMSAAVVAQGELTIPGARFGPLAVAEGSADLLSALHALAGWGDANIGRIKR
ncbi:MAG: hypothetical protein ACREF3_14575, partial [Acetobacteraceae bacterium]